MESFYTQVSRYGNNLLYRGFNYNGKRVQKRVHFNPTLYVPSDKKQTDWTSLDGKAVEPIRFDSMREAKDFLEKYKDILDDLNPDSKKVYNDKTLIEQTTAQILVQQEKRLDIPQG